MNKAYIQGIIDDLKSSQAALPSELAQKIDQLEQALNETSAEQFAEITDGAIGRPSQHREGPDVRYMVYEVYTQLNDMVQEHRHNGSVDEQVRSALSRFQGQVDAYDRDFP